MHNPFLFSAFYIFLVLSPVDRSFVQVNCWHDSCDRAVGRTVAESNDISNLGNDFENGVVHPWIEQSEASAKWKIENITSPWQTNNAAPTPLNGKNYLRIDRGTSLSFNIAILRSPHFKIPPGNDNVIFSFSFWIRSKWPQFTNLELYLAKEENESLLLSLHNYSDINNLAWQSQSVLLTDSSSTLTLVFYAYCGLDMEDAVAIDDLRFISQSTTSIPSPSSTESIPSSSSTESTAVTDFATTEISKDTTVVTDMSTTSTPLKTTTEQEAQTTTTTSTSGCPSSFGSDTRMSCWILEGKCYCFSLTTASLSWMNADAFCKSGNMTLASLETKEEDELIYNHVKTIPGMSNTRYWSSGKYSMDEDRFWEWESTEPYQPFTYTNWSPGEPSENEFGYCVYLDFNSDFSSGYWKNLLCTNPRRFICESIN
ncbi:asialoglycoprotein receptor 1-like [Daphnia carinata]|uniref:asialoglycoprotein receptor 1-like n=1 Tax=Daphnia carinata TaxID=120202 RepID=UPI00257AED69|nr:asialoglycoprotein receptor 1-like [Daphnia carinata]